jgi:two-component system nitrate/nitrite response regulator NarL
MNTMKAVVVEDFKLIATIWEKLLKDLGFDEVHVFHHADGVKEGILEIEPDIVFMDVNLPGAKNGLDITEEVIKVNSTIKVMMLTIHTDPSYIQRAFAIGAKGFVTKNSPISEIKDAVNSIITGNTYLCKEISEQ